MTVPAGQGPDGEEICVAMRGYCGQTLQRRMSTHAERRVLEYSDLSCDAHPELAGGVEFLAFAVRDAIAHADLSAEARIAKKTHRADQHDGDASSL